ncbi:MAG: hypothetical protein ACREJX_08740 [Polyangiaceae bacterium]
MIGALLFAIAPSGCATVIGLDSGNSLPDDGGDPPDGASSSDAAATSSSDAASTADTGPICAPETADCNDDPKDGCETKLGSPMHCSSCTDVCLPGHDCSNGACCLAINQVCVLDGDCCSGNCDGQKCNKPPGG